MSRFLTKLFSRERRSDRDTAPWAATPTKSGLTEPLISSFIKYNTSSIFESTTSTLVESTTSTLVESTTSTLVESTTSTLLDYTTSSLVEPATSAFDNLEREILLRIIGHLELHDQFLLSHTCQTLRNVTQRDWVSTLDRLPLAPRLDFWAGIAFVLPNHWVCGPCYRLHKINKDDVPWKERGYREREKDSCQYQNGTKIGIFRKKIEEKHVQLALKFTRLNTVNQDYLRSIMEPFNQESFMNSRSRPSYKRFHCSPKIVAERFLLHTQLVFGDGLRFSASELEHHKICPHMPVYHPFLDGRPYPKMYKAIPGDLTRDVVLGLENPGRTFDGHCSRCPTDYSVLAGPKRITISTWHDFGSYKSPEDESWTVHMYSEENSYSRGTIVHHEPGSIRRLYTTGTCGITGRVIE